MPGAYYVHDLIWSYSSRRRQTISSSNMKNMQCSETLSNLLKVELPVSVGTGFQSGPLDSEIVSATQPATTSDENWIRSG